MYPTLAKGKKVIRQSSLRVYQREVERKQKQQSSNQIYYSVDKKRVAVG